MAYAKFYVNPPWFQPQPHSNGQGLVRPSFYQPLGPVSVGRRSAAQVCAHTDSVAPGDGRSGRIDDGFRSGYGSQYSQVFSVIKKAFPNPN